MHPLDPVEKKKKKKEEKKKRSNKNEVGSAVFSPGLYSRLCRPALIPDRPALMSNRWLEIY